jgi:acetoin utilization deacetylase AcuC-like enzyme
MTTATLTDARYLAHDDPGHVERAERLRAIGKALDASGLRDELLTLTARPANEAELLRVHTQGHLDTLQRFGEMGGGNLDPDTYMNEASWESALWSAGGALRMVEAVLGGESDNGFALLRPPGHHATPARAMGFCLLSNIALAARHAMHQFGLERVAIVDFDVHHGNGTQDAFYDDPDVLFCSTHAYPFYPGTGAVSEVGMGAGRGTTLNVPLPMHVGDAGYTKTFSEIIIPALRTWKPQLILLSAGYDSHWSDPLGPMVLSINGFTQLTHMLYDAAAELCDGRFVMILEGGYNLDALGAGAVSAYQVLLGKQDIPDPLGQINAREPQIDSILAHIRQNHPLFTE